MFPYMKMDFEKNEKFPEKFFQNFDFWLFSVPKLKLLKNIGNFFVFFFVTDFLIFLGAGYQIVDFCR